MTRFESTVGNRDRIPGFPVRSLPARHLEWHWDRIDVS